MNIDQATSPKKNSADKKKYNLKPDEKYSKVAHEVAIKHSSGVFKAVENATNNETVSTGSRPNVVGIKNGISPPVINRKTPDLAVNNTRMIEINDHQENLILGATHGGHGTQRNFELEIGGYAESANGLPLLPASVMIKRKSESLLEFSRSIHPDTYRGIIESQAKSLSRVAEIQRDIVTNTSRLDDHAKDLYRDISNEKEVLIPAYSKDHAMLVSIQKMGADEYSLKIFNSGFLSNEYHASNNSSGGMRKINVFAEYKSQTLSAENISKLFFLTEKNPQALYNWAEDLSGQNRIPLNAEDAVWQSPQKGGNCIDESLNAWLKYDILRAAKAANLPDKNAISVYRQAKANSIESGLQDYISSVDSNVPVHMYGVVARAQMRADASRLNAMSIKANFGRDKSMGDEVFKKYCDMVDLLLDESNGVIEDGNLLIRNCNQATGTGHTQYDTKSGQIINTFKNKDGVTTKYEYNIEMNESIITLSEKKTRTLENGDIAKVVTDFFLSGNAEDLVGIDILEGALPKEKINQVAGVGGKTYLSLKISNDNLEDFSGFSISNESGVFKIEHSAGNIQVKNISTESGGFKSLAFSLGGESLTRKAFGSNSENVPLDHVAGINQEIRQEIRQDLGLCVDPRFKLDAEGGEITLFYDSSLRKCYEQITPDGGTKQLSQTKDFSWRSSRFDSNKKFMWTVHSERPATNANAKPGLQHDIQENHSTIKHTLDGSIEITKNANGDVTNIERRDKDKNITNIIVYEYDEGGELKSIKNYNSDYQIDPEETTKIIRDEGGKINLIIEYDESHIEKKIISTTQYDYANKIYIKNSSISGGKLLEERFRINDHTPVSTTIYDEHGEPTRKVTYHDGGTISETKNTISGSSIKNYSYKGTNFGGSIVLGEEIEKDLSGNVTKFTTYDDDGSYSVTNFNIERGYNIKTNFDNDKSAENSTVTLGDGRTFQVHKSGAIQGIDWSQDIDPVLHEAFAAATDSYRPIEIGNVDYFFENSPVPAKALMIFDSQLAALGIPFDSLKYLNVGSPEAFQNVEIDTSLAELEKWKNNVRGLPSELFIDDNKAPLLAEIDALARGEGAASMQWQLINLGGHLNTLDNLVTFGTVNDLYQLGKNAFNSPRAASKCLNGLGFIAVVAGLGWGVSTAVKWFSDIIPDVSGYFSGVRAAESPEKAYVALSVVGGPAAGVAAAVDAKSKGATPTQCLKAFFAGSIGLYDPNDPDGAQGSGTPVSSWNLGFGCWVAREIYGENNPRWLVFREWLVSEAPSWFCKLYFSYGRQFANFIKDKPWIKIKIKSFMDAKIDPSIDFNGLKYSRLMDRYLAGSKLNSNTLKNNSQ